MKDDHPPSSKTSKSKKKKTSRRLTLRSRTRLSIRKVIERALSADRIWSLALVGIGLVMIGSGRCGDTYPEYELGQLVTETVTLESDLQVPDEEAMKARKMDAASKVPDVWVHDETRSNRLANALSEVFDQGREYAKDPSQSFPSQLKPDVLRALQRQRWSKTLEESLVTLVRESMDNWIIASRSLIENSAAIDLVHRPSGREERLSRTRYESLKNLDEIRERVKRRILRDLPIPQEDRIVIANWISQWIDINTSLDDQETRERRMAAAAVVEPIMENLKRGTVILEEGERIQTENLARLESVRNAAMDKIDLIEWVSIFVLLSILAFFLHRYSVYHQRHYSHLDHLHALLVGVTLAVLAISKALLWLVQLLIQTPAFKYPFNQPEVYFYLAPIAAGPIIIALLSNARIAMVASAFSALLFGMMCGEEFSLLIWALLSQWSGVYAISTYRDRAALLKAGLVVGGISSLLVLALMALSGSFSPWEPVLAAAGMAFLGGAIGVGLVVSFTLPLLEGLFGVLTEVRLLELSNSEHPLIKELAVKAPGTYNHSLVVGTLAEEAARAIGANALFCRVAAAYHDIGKMNKAEYYVENQSGENPHDKLSPSMSALIIGAHVKDGLAMAREAGLPKQIIDIIPQHHGTRLMSFFYDKAKRLADPTMEEIKESDFRYPGPKPQTREAAIFMMADGVEAAARSLDEPSPNRLREVIRKVTNAIILEGQLEECDLTFTDLEKIQGAFHRLLVSMYHQRVDYPSFQFGNAKAAMESADNSTSDESEQAEGWTS